MKTIEQPSASATKAINRGLQGLDEAPLSADEAQAMADPVDVNLVSALVELSVSARGGDPLHAFDRRRVLRTIEHRLDGADEPRVAAGLSPVVSVLAAVAAAAVVFVLPAGSKPDASGVDPQAVEALHAAAHGGLEALGSTETGARAREVAAAYAPEEGS